MAIVVRSKEDVAKMAPLANGFHKVTLEAAGKEPYVFGMRVSMDGAVCKATPKLKGGDTFDALKAQLSAAFDGGVAQVTIAKEEASYLPAIFGGLLVVMLLLKISKT